tara:strand:+ start:321 stop:665 length:345 start_codon:yes stop_codon:yes gene_type:complete
MPIIATPSFPVAEIQKNEIVEIIDSELPIFSSNNSFWGIFSFSCALLSMGLMPNMLAIVPISLLGIISGAIGFNKKRKGLAIAGFILSIIFFIISILLFALILIGGGVGGAFGG